MVVFVEDGPEIGWAELGDDDDNVKDDGDVIVVGVSVAFAAEGNSFIFGGLGGLGGGGGPGS